MAHGAAAAARGALAVAVLLLAAGPQWGPPGAAAEPSASVAAAAPDASAAPKTNVRTNLELTVAQTQSQFAWNIITSTPQPTALSIPADGVGTVDYEVTYKRELLSTALKVSGTVTFENVGAQSVSVRYGFVSVCNGFLTEPAKQAPAKEAAVPAASGGSGCTGSFYSLPLEIKKGSGGVLLQPRKPVKVSFGGTIQVARTTSDKLNNDGISGPVATAYVDATISDGTRDLSSPQQFRFDINPDTTRDFGFTAMAFDTFVPAPVKVLTAPLAQVTGAKIPDGLGMKLSDTTSFAYQAKFKFVPGTTPCQVPLSAMTAQRLVVDNPGDAPLPQPQSTAVTVVFTGCKRTEEARVARVIASMDNGIEWGLEKTSNATGVRVKRGQYGVIAFKVKAIRRRPKVFSYAISGSVLVSPAGGQLGGKPLPVEAVTVKLSSGDSGPAKCLAPNPDGSLLCRFDNIRYSLKSQAVPTAGTAAATVKLRGGRTLEAPPQDFDFTNLPLSAQPGMRAELSDTFDGESLKAARGAGIKVQWDNDGALPNPPNAGIPPLVIDEGDDFKYNVRFTGGSKCGRFKLFNNAKLEPLNSKQRPVTHRKEIEVEVVGC